MWRRVSLAGSGVGQAVTNWLARHRVGLRISTVADLWRAPVRAGLRLSDALRATTLDRVGLKLSQTVQGAVTSTVRPGIRLRPFLTGTMEAKSGLKITQDRVVLQGTYGASDTTQVAFAGRSDWTNTTAANGKVNATVAQVQSDTLAERGGQLNMNYADFVGKDTLVIREVYLDFYVSQSGTVLNNGTFSLRYRKATTGSTVLLTTINGNTSNLTTPLTFDVSAAFTTWADLNNLQVVLTAIHPAAVAQITTQADAVHLRVVADRIVNV